MAEDLDSGIRQFNQLKGLLDKSTAVKDSLGGSRENQALRAVRTKRDAEEAGMQLENIFGICSDG